MIEPADLEFERCVILYGSKTEIAYIQSVSMFERCVLLNGSKTVLQATIDTLQFERCVILNGSKTYVYPSVRKKAFESCLILNGSKTEKLLDNYSMLFERCVILNGSKTHACAKIASTWFESCVIPRDNQDDKAMASCYYMVTKVKRQFSIATPKTPVSILGFSFCFEPFSPVFLVQEAVFKQNNQRTRSSNKRSPMAFLIPANFKIRVA